MTYGRLFTLMNDMAYNPERTVVTSVTLYPSDLLLARRVAEAAGSRSLSAGLRAIIAYYRRHNDRHAEPAPRS